MSEHDQVASQAHSISDADPKEHAAPEQLESLHTDLPDDATALKAIVGTLRLEVSQKDKTITKLKEQMDEVKATHSVVLQRSAEWQDELETLRLRLPQLEQELRAEKQAREAESDRVKDLRIRAEESRRAIMRLQGEQSDARAKAKADNRRSWNPAAFQQQLPDGIRDEREEAELKKSKRASLAFGPNALNLNLARSSSSQSGHRRSNSGGRSVSGASGTSKGEGDENEEPLSPFFATFANGLRGLRLSGTAGMNGTTNSLLLPVANHGDDNSSAPNSRRSSFRSDAGRSPRMATADLAVPDTPTDFTSLGARLAVPGTSPRAPMLSSPSLSQGAASSAGVAAPIIEDNEEEEHRPDSAKTLAFPGRQSSAVSETQERELRAKEVEIERMAREMTEMRLAMEEAIEARKASEACMKALRDFIATHDAEADKNGGLMGDHADAIVQKASVGAGLLKGVKLPPLPTDDIDEDEEKVHANVGSPQKSAVGGWSMKLPTFARKATGSSTASAGAVTVGEEAKPAGAAGTAGEGEAGSVHSSPRNITSGGAGVAAAQVKSIASGFAGFGNLLSRGGTTLSSEAATSTSTSTTPATENATSPQPNEDGAAASAFKGFGWFKRTSSLTPASPATEVTVEEKVLSPPFRSLDHDQLSISRQAVVSPVSENGGGDAKMQPLGRNSVRSSSGSTSALAMAARFGDDEIAKRAEEEVKRKSEQEVGERAGKAQQKVGSVEHLTDVLPSFD